MILIDNTERPDTIMESLFRRWYAERISDKIYDEMENALFPEEILILRMSERFETYIAEINYELKARAKAQLTTNESAVPVQAPSAQIAGTN